MSQSFTDQNFTEEVLQATKPVMVDFSAEWCGPCKMMAPIIDEFAKARTDIKIGKIDVDENPNTAGQYGVVSIPTLIFFKGGKEVDRLVGFQAKDALITKMDALQ